MIFPFFSQLDSMDCGPSCIRMVAKYYGKSFSLQALRSKAFITKSGVSMLVLVYKRANNLGYKMAMFQLSYQLDDIYGEMLVERFGGDPNLVFR